MPGVSHARDLTNFNRTAAEAIFYLALGTLFTHELDAVLNHEWRVMPLLKLLPDDQGIFVFVASHVPIFAGIIAVAASPNHKTRLMTRLVICTFLVIHAGLHLGFSNDPAYEFDAVLSAVLIYGGAALGALYLVLPQRRTSGR